jgi:hypothetical protein
MSDRQRKDLRNCFIILAAVGVILGMLAGCAVTDTQQPSAPKVEIPVHVYDDGGTSMRLMGGPCADPRVMEIILVGMPQYVDRFKAIESTWRMQDGSRQEFSGCWAEVSAEEVGFEALLLIFEDGERYLVNKAEFLAGKGQGT